MTTDHDPAAVDDVPVAISALEHYEYCPRQCALIHVDGLWVDNEHTVRGQHGHRRADTPGGRHERGRRVVRGLRLWSERYGLTGRADAVEAHPDGTVEPVEYKIGVRHGDTADLQLCAQALCLEEMFNRPVTHGAIWYSAARRRRRVPIDAALRARTLTAITQIRDLRSQPQLPAPVNDGRCTHCQLAGLCLPDLVDNPRRVDRYLTQEVYRCGS